MSETRILLYSLVLVMYSIRAPKGHFVYGERSFCDVLMCSCDTVYDDISDAFSGVEALCCGGNGSCEPARAHSRRDDARESL